MTIEKAIGQLEDIKDEFEYFPDSKEALSMAIDALQICENCICAEQLREEMYHQAFEEEPEGMVRWDSGLWIRYKLFETTLDKILEEKAMTI